MITFSLKYLEIYTDEKEAVNELTNLNGRKSRERVLDDCIRIKPTNFPKIQKTVVQIVS